MEPRTHGRITPWAQKLWSIKGMDGAGSVGARGTAAALVGAAGTGRPAAFRRASAAAAGGAPAPRGGRTLPGSK